MGVEAGDVREAVVLLALVRWAVEGATAEGGADGAVGHFSSVDAADGDCCRTAVHHLNAVGAVEAGANVHLQQTISLPLVRGK